MIRYWFAMILYASLVLTACSPDESVQGLPTNDDWELIQLSDVVALGQHAELAKYHNIARSPEGELFYWVGFWDPETTLIGSYQIRQISQSLDDGLLVEDVGAYTWANWDWINYKNISIAPDDKSLVYFTWHGYQQNELTQIGISDLVTKRLHKDFEGSVHSIYHIDQDNIVFDIELRSDMHCPATAVWTMELSSGAMGVFYQVCNDHAYIKDINIEKGLILLEVIGQSASKSVQLLDFDGNLMFEKVLDFGEAIARPLDISSSGDKILLRIDRYGTDDSYPFICIVDVPSGTVSFPTDVVESKSTIFLKTVYCFSPDDSKVLFNSSFDSQFSEGPSEEDSYFRELHHLDIASGEIERLTTNFEIEDFYGYYKNNENQLVLKARLDEADEWNIFLMKKR